MEATGCPFQEYSALADEHGMVSDAGGISSCHCRSRLPRFGWIAYLSSTRICVVE